PLPALTADAPDTASRKPRPDDRQPDLQKSALRKLAQKRASARSGERTRTTSSHAPRNAPPEAIRLSGRSPRRTTKKIPGQHPTVPADKRSAPSKSQPSTA